MSNLRRWITRLRLRKHARPAGFLILAVVTVYGIHRFVTGDWAAVMTYWQDKLWVLPQVFLLAAIDVALEGIAWMWVYARFGMLVWEGGSAGAFLAGRAGLLLPVQFGRVIRPDAMTRLGRGGAAECLKAEGAVEADEGVLGETAEGQGVAPTFTLNRAARAAPRQCYHGRDETRGCPGVPRRVLWPACRRRHPADSPSPWGVFLARCVRRDRCHRARGVIQHQ